MMNSAPKVFMAASNQASVRSECCQHYFYIRYNGIFKKILTVAYICFKERGIQLR